MLVGNAGMEKNMEATMLENQIDHQLEDEMESRGIWGFYRDV